MPSLFSLLDVARDGILAQSTALDVTGQNVSNAGTAGYTRRVANLETTTTNGAWGSVRVASIGRTFDRFAERRAVAEMGLKGAATSRSDALAEAESILAPSGVPSIGDQMATFYASMSTLAQNPGDISTRTQAIGDASALAQSISSTASQLSAARTSLLGRAQDVAGEVNERLGRIADLNRQISTAKGQGENPADLMDQRDAMVRAVGERIGAQAIEQPNGMVTLLSSGTALVDGDRAATLSVAPDANGNLSIQVVRPSGATDDITQNVTSGTLGGLREARDVDLAKTAAGLDKLAYDFTSTVNAVHTTGFGLDGVSGRPLFQPAAGPTGAARAMAVDPSILADPKALAASSTAAGLPGDNGAALAISQLATAPLGTSASPAQAFAAVAAGLGSAKQSAEAEVTLRTATLTQATSLRDSASGVSLDEEMVNLTKFQRAFEASTRVLSTVNELLGDLVKGF
jgi:flagellar hook-associated protein 1 FlgK